MSHLHLAKLPVRHFTGVLEANVTYATEDQDQQTLIEVISIHSPHLNRSGEYFDLLPGIDVDAINALKAALYELEASKAVAA